MTPSPEMIAAPVLASAPGLHHGFFTRRGGVSDGPFRSLNCGLSTGDDPARVRANRESAIACFGLSLDRLASVHQVHSARVVVVNDEWTPGAPQSADGLATRRRGVALGVLGADCAPVLLADAEAGVIGAAHAGWRGALAGVTDGVVDAMVGLGASPSRIVAAIGPCIAQPSYEVGADFPAPFLDRDAASRAFFAEGRDGHWQFDLPGYLAARLNRRGLAAVAPPPGDTAAAPDLFFSHRRCQLDGSGTTGRLLSVIALES